MQISENQRIRILSLAQKSGQAPGQGSFFWSKYKEYYQSILTTRITVAEGRRQAFAQKGTHVSLRTVYRTMSEAGLIHRHRRPHGITKADTELRTERI